MLSKEVAIGSIRCAIYAARTPQSCREIDFTQVHLQRCLIFQASICVSCLQISGGVTPCHYQADGWEAACDIVRE